MSGWASYQYWEELHAMPIDEHDKEQHMFDCVCPCGVSGDEIVNGTRVVTHSSFDGREGIEKLYKTITQSGILLALSFKDLELFLNGSHIVSKNITHNFEANGMTKLVCTVDLSKISEIKMKEFISKAQRIMMFEYEIYVINQHLK